MQSIYSTDNAAEAHMISHMLEQNGIMAHILGEQLNNGMGGFLSPNIIKISVIDEEVKHAKDLIQTWDKIQESRFGNVDEHKRNVRHPMRLEKATIFLSGILIGYLLSIWVSSLNPN